MFTYTNIHHVFPAGATNPYDKKMQHEIDVDRKSFDGILFIDRVLKAVGITKAKVYPPKTENALKQLHQQVCDVTMSTHHKLSLFYYLLLDFDQASGHGSLSDNFVEASGMPKKYQLFMKGLWYMDRQNLPKALESLAHPSLIPDFADDIMTILVRRAPENDYSLALSYFYAVQPNFKTSTALELLFDALARTNVTEALLYSRTHPVHVRELLFPRLISAVFDGEKGPEFAARSSELAFQPFQPMEEEWFEEYLTNGDGKSFKKAKDTLLIRKIGCDQFSDIAKLRVGGQWASVLSGLKAGTSGQMH